MLLLGSLFPVFLRLLSRTLFFIAFVPFSALAGNFGVSPIRLDLDADAKSGAVTISNDENADLRVQIKLYEWTQDTSGKDQYKESEDLLYFPRVITIGPKEQRVVRVGLRRAPTAAQEKSYRLYIEEIPPPPPTNEPGGAHLTFTIKFGVPVFVHPAKQEPKGTIQSLSLEKGTLHVKVRNSGNVHFMINSVEASAGTLFSQTVKGWYLLPGAMRDYEIPVPAQVCTKLGRINVKVQTDQLQLESSLNSGEVMCKH